MIIDFDQVTADDVSRHFGRRRALSRISFRAGSGTILGLLGPNGAGKSTMIALLATLMRPSEGDISTPAHVDGHGASLRRPSASLATIFPHPELTAHENLTFFVGLYGAANARAALRLHSSGRSLGPCGRPDCESRGGCGQAFALERALIHRPRLVLLD